MPDEKSEPPQPYPQPESADWDFDLSDARNEDAKAQPLKGAGCSMRAELYELDQLKVRAS